MVFIFAVVCRFGKRYVTDLFVTISVFAVVPNLCDVIGESVGDAGGEGDLERFVGDDVVIDLIITINVLRLLSDMNNNITNMCISTNIIISSIVSNSMHISNTDCK